MYIGLLMNIPRYSYELIALLDLQEPTPKFPNSRASVVSMDEGQIRLGIWHAARRALVDELLVLQAEDDDESEADSRPSTDESSNLLDTPILDPSGSVRKGVAPLHVAPAGPTDDKSGGG